MLVLPDRATIVASDRHLTKFTGQASRMTDTTIVHKHRLWPVFVMPVLVVIAAAAWSAFWFYAASQVDQTVDAWRAREAALRAHL